MAWPKGTPRKTGTRIALETMGQEPEKPQQEPKNPAPPVEPEKCDICHKHSAVAFDPARGKVCSQCEPKANIKIIPHDTTIYHNEHEPKDLKAGEPIPEGWTTEPATLKVLWKNKSDGTWERQDKE